MFVEIDEKEKYSIAFDENKSINVMISSSRSSWVEKESRKYVVYFLLREDLDVTFEELMLRVNEL